MISVEIRHDEVMGIVEGLSVIASQHNVSVPFERLWASPSENRKLNLYYGDAISELEHRIKDWLIQSTPQMHPNGTWEGSVDYTLAINTPSGWPTRLSGLLRNKVQNYMSHAVASGWFSTFSGLSVPDYASIASQELTDIHELLMQREFGFYESSRLSELQKGGDNNADATDRCVDLQKGGENNADAGLRRTDEFKSLSSTEPEAMPRRSDTDHKNTPSDLSRPFALSRHRDNACVMIGHDVTDWSGTGFGYGGCRDNRANRANGANGLYGGDDHHVLPGDSRYWPRHDKPWYGELEELSHQHQAELNKAWAQETRKLGNGPYMEKYRDKHDQEFMQEHECGHDDCGAHGLMPLDW